LPRLQLFDLHNQIRLIIGSPLLALGVPAPLIHGDLRRGRGHWHLLLLLFDLAGLARLRLGMSLEYDLDLLDLLLFLAHLCFYFIYMSETTGVLGFWGFGVLG
jgi:hypothetical protein